MSGINESAVIRCLKDISLLPSGHGGSNRRTIYEAGKGKRLEPSGTFYIDYASYPGGIYEPIPADVIRRMESTGVLVRAYGPQINAWVLA